MAGYHRHYNLTCLDCGVVVYPRATCVMWAGPSGCTLAENMYCEKCIGTQSVSDSGQSEGYIDTEVGVHLPEEYDRIYKERVAQGNVRDLLPSDVSNQTEGVVQEQEDQEGTQDSPSPQPTRLEQLRLAVLEKKRLSR
jgi:hypothetical protein